jgi:hypothetical protein
MHNPTTQSENEHFIQDDAHFCNFCLEIMIEIENPLHLLMT